MRTWPALLQIPGHHGRAAQERYELTFRAWRTLRDEALPVECIQGVRAMANPGHSSHTLQSCQCHMHSASLDLCACLSIGMRHLISRSFTGINSQRLVRPFLVASCRRMQCLEL